MKKIKIPSLKKNYKFFWAYLVVGILLALAAVIVMPIWSKTSVFWKNWGPYLIRVILFILLTLYLFGFLLHKVLKASKNVIKVLTIIEFALLFVLDCGLILPLFGIGIPNVTEPCILVGIALWVRGVVEIFRAYYYKADTTIETYPVYWLAISIGMITLGVVMIVKNFITTVTFQWILFVLLVLVFVICLIYAIYGWPHKKRK